MDVVGRALDAEARAEVFRLKHRVTELERERDQWRARALEQQTIWLLRRVTTPALDAHIASLTTHTRGEG